MSGIPWQSSGWGSELSQTRPLVQSLVGELRSHKPCGAAKKTDVILFCYAMNTLVMYEVAEQVETDLHLKIPI